MGAVNNSPGERIILQFPNPENDDPGRELKEDDRKRAGTPLVEFRTTVMAVHTP